MKINYINKVDALLIQKQGFEPVINNEGHRIQYEGMRIVQKVVEGKFIIVELIDADSLSVDQVKDKLEIASKNLTQMSASTVIAFQVFIFNATPDEIKLQLIRAGQMEDIYIRKYLPCVTVDLTNKEINKLYNLPIDAQGLEIALNSALHPDSCSEGVSVDTGEYVNPALEKESETNYSPTRLMAKVPFFTYGLILVNVLIWLAMNIYPLGKGISVQSLFTPLGAKENYLIFSGEYWRFLTPIFLHANFQHLAMNCLSLFVFGKIIEGMYGHVKFAFIYFAAGIIGNIASFMFSPHSAVGASGSIFGLMGALFYFRVENPILFKRYFGNNILVMVVVNIIYGFIEPGIDNFAHIGGLVGGFFTSGIVKIKKAPNKLLGRPVFILATILLLIGGLYYGFNLSGNAKYYQLNNLVQGNNLFEAEKKGEEIIDMKILDKDLQVNTLFRVAMLEYSQGKYEEAIQRATYLKEIDASRGHYLLGIIYFYDQEYDLAEEELKTSVKIDPNLREEVDVFLKELE